MADFPIAAARPRLDGSAGRGTVAAGGSRPQQMNPVPETEFRSGWPAVLACFCVAVFAWGFGFYGQAVFLAELHRLHGWPTSTIGAA
jgi:hypothetical protein